jgi:S1-C subfamily serine protease
VGGTGVVIEGKRILTNAHVVQYASQVFVEPYQSSEKLAVRVEAVSSGVDLAVLKLEDESFFEKRPPLARSPELPEVKESVLVYGYPQGGSSLSITKGIVSRIEFAPYNEHASGLRVQIDAAINPGNSGGPALVNDKMVGLVFSRLQASDNIGYMIPSEEIELFLKDIEDGHYDGKPAMHDSLQTLENEALRGLLKLDKKATGMVVHEPDDRGDTPSPLKEWDLITKIGDREIDNVGMVQVKGNLRLRFQYLIQKLACGGKVPLTIVRDGQTMAVALPVSAKRPKLIDSLQGRYPSYFVFGPLTFSPVTTEFLSGLDRASAALYPILSAIGSPLVTRRADKPRFEGEELVVVAAPMFPHRLSKGYSNPFSKVVKEVNGVPIRNLRHLVETLRDAKDRYVTIRFDDRASETIVFDREEVRRATDEILTDNGVRQQASDDLEAVWEPTK